MFDYKLNDLYISNNGPLVLTKINRSGMELYAIAGYLEDGGFNIISTFFEKRVANKFIHGMIHNKPKEVDKPINTIDFTKLNSKKKESKPETKINYEKALQLTQDESRSLTDALREKRSKKKQLIFSKELGTEIEIEIESF